MSEPSEEAVKWAAENDDETASMLAARAYDAGRASGLAERVALRERLLSIKSRNEGDEDSYDRAKGWNACCDAVRRAIEEP